MRRRFSMYVLITAVILALTILNHAFASSYRTSFCFESSIKGVPRFFDGQNIAFETSTATSTPWRHAINNTYTVTLYRDNGWLGKEKIGEKTMNRDSWDRADWSNVGSGNYYFYLSKAIDGIVLVDNNVKIYNY